MSFVSGASSSQFNGLTLNEKQSADYAINFKQVSDQIVEMARVSLLEEQKTRILQLTNLAELCDFSKELDYLDDEKRAEIWQKHKERMTVRNAATPEEPSSEKTKKIPEYRYFSPTLKAYRSELESNKRCVDVLIEVIKEYSDAILTSTLQRSFYIPPKSQISAFSSDSVPCCPENVLPPKIHSPFGVGPEATLAQLRCLLFWATSLDELAPAHKVALWRVCKNMSNEFGYDHDINSFENTINIFKKDVFLHSESIKILFSAIGFLRNQGIIKQDFVWPDQPKAMEFPVFHGNTEARILKRRKERRGTRDDEVQVDPLDISFLDQKTEKNLYERAPAGTTNQYSRKTKRDAVTHAVLAEVIETFSLSTGNAFSEIAEEPVHKRPRVDDNSATAEEKENHLGIARNNQIYFFDEKRSPKKLTNSQSLILETFPMLELEPFFGSMGEDHIEIV